MEADWRKAIDVTYVWPTIFLVWLCLIPFEPKLPFLAADGSKNCDQLTLHIASADTLTANLNTN